MSRPQPNRTSSLKSGSRKQRKKVSRSKRPKTPVKTRSTDALPHKIQARETAILHAAFLELCEKGYDNATIASIARRAGVADGTIYKYVADKRELLFRVLARSIEDHVNSVIQNAARLQSGREMIEYFCYRHLDFWAKNTELSMLYASESRTRDQHHWPIYREVNRRYVRVVEDAIAYGIAKGEFSAEVPVLLLRDIVIGAVEQVAWGKASASKAIDPSVMASQIVSVVLNGIAVLPKPGIAGDPIDRLEALILRLESRTGT